MLLREQNTACGAMLNTFYDVVTELDSNLKILSSGRELSYFLNVKPGQSLEGTEFQEFLPLDDERSRFLHAMQRPFKQEESIADVMHVSLLNGQRDVRPVELFTFKFSGLNGRLRHLVGIRGDADESFGGHLPPLPVHSGRRILTVSGDVSVSFRTSDPDFPITGSSEAFGQVLGGIELEGRSLLAMVFPADAFESWTQLVMNRHHTADPNQPVELVNTFKVWIQAEPAGQKCLKATCHAVFSQTEKSDQTDSASETSYEHLIMRLKFTDLEYAPRPGSTSQRKRRSSSRSRSHHTASSNQSSWQGSSSRSFGTPRNLTRHGLPHTAVSI